MTASTPEWTDGYSVDVEYTAGFYNELSPTVIDRTIAHQRLTPPRQAGRPFTYLELGCAHALTVTGLAAAHPEGQFFANDFMPAHISGARKFADQAGLTNLTLLEDSFEELIERDLPPMDYITLHGIFSWVNAATRAAVVEIIRRRLKAGGAVYVSYNTLPGWSSMEPVRHLMKLAADAHSGPALDRLDHGMVAIKSLIDNGAAFFAANPTVAQRVEEFQLFSPKYLVHEYLHETWRNFYFSDVIKELSSAKLSFIASANFAEQFIDIYVPETSRQLLVDTKDPVLRETYRDFATNQRFRRDVYVRGPTRMTDWDYAQAVPDWRMALIAPRGQWTLELDTPAGKTKMFEDVYRPALEVMSEGPITIAEFIAHPKLAHIAPDQRLPCVNVMLAAGYIAPAEPAMGEGTRRASTDRHNIAAMRASLNTMDNPRALVSPVTAAMVAMNPLDQAFILAEREGHEDVPGTVATWLSERGRSVLLDGRPAQTLEDARAAINSALTEFNRDRRPVFRNLGLCA